jgi:hypothetical protein
LACDVDLGDAFAGKSDRRTARSYKGFALNL